MGSPVRSRASVLMFAFCLLVALCFPSATVRIPFTAPSNITPPPRK